MANPQRFGKRYNTFDNFYFPVPVFAGMPQRTTLCQPLWGPECRDGLGFCAAHPGKQGGIHTFQFRKKVLSVFFSVIACGEKPWQDTSFIFAAFAGRRAVSCHYQGVGTSHPSQNEEVWQENPPERRFQEELESVTSGPCPFTPTEPTAVPLTLFSPQTPKAPWSLSLHFALDLNETV